jgi:WD40 repeat protein
MKSIYSSSLPPSLLHFGRIRLRPQCIAFDPLGDMIAVGFTSGDIKFLSTNTFEDVSSFSPSADPIVHLKFSPSGLYLAGYDSTNHVIILKQQSGEEEEEHTSPKGTYTYLGRAITHSAPITGLEFGLRENGEVLMSIGEDRWRHSLLTHSKVSTENVWNMISWNRVQRMESRSLPLAPLGSNCLLVQLQLFGILISEKTSKIGHNLSPDSLRHLTERR